MATISESQVDELLRQAEARLQKKATQDIAPAAVPKSQTLTPSVSASTSSKGKDSLTVRQPQLAQQHAKKKFQDTAGDQWFGLPKTDLTPEMKRNWQLLRMRNLLDPKQQKKPLRASVPKYSHLGEIISNPQDPHTAKITRKERKRTFLEEVMNSHSQSKLRHRYAGIQKEKTSGKKASYQKFMAQRKKRK
ncbi:hypothetical protein S7711_04531 [Stachybotrys chartarum IBT 7711]|uniref:Fcf2 pre-rRNA processing C-terminal domain-containing protein n=1 Tax=Stachybotrys chartarum (strain CBS 109288 / IBT 7711) TaxID=1280523 RepID=A0A084APP9_STACB|nr:hypothetical protein S7711_04531 [Stachybotrys chartarum IBT 7711]KFA75220.1 hypothetical protein S40288_00208 [Stachybotrys chartarum IBT 40288]